MKMSKVAGFLLISVLLNSRGFAQSESKEQINVPLSDPGKSYTLNVSLINGSINVVSYAGKEILIEAQLGTASRKSENKAAPNGMRRITPENGMDVTAEEKNNRIEIHTDSWKRTINLSLKVPQGGNYKLHTVNNGEITVENLSGALEINNVNGAIKLNNISGSVVANTVNGDIITTFKSVEGNTPMAFSTLNGNVDITFPQSLKTNVKLKSDNGEIFSDFDIDISKNQSKINKSGDKGMYKLQIEDWVYGKINGGGAEILMKNMEGNIYLRKAR